MCGPIFQCLGTDKMNFPKRPAVVEPERYADRYKSPVAVI
jgi:hypothetical protein